MFWKISEKEGLVLTSIPTHKTVSSKTSHLWSGEMNNQMLSEHPFIVCFSLNEFVHKNKPGVKRFTASF